MTLFTRSNKPVHPIGIGTWNIASQVNQADLGSKYRGVEAVHGREDQEIAGLRYSLDKGQNHIDCAELYGGFYTDEVVGRALAGYPREDLYIADKLWKTSVTPGALRPTVENMLNKLGTNYLDMLYIHAPWRDVDWRQAIPQIDQLIDEGVVRHFGVSNFTTAHMAEALRLAKHPITANQMNYNVLYQDEVTDPFREFCRQYEITIVAYQPIKRGEVLASPVVRRIAEAHDATPAQVALAWLIQQEALPIPKAIEREHIDENIGALRVILTEDEMHELRAL